MGRGTGNPPQSRQAVRPFPSCDDFALSKPNPTTTTNQSSLKPTKKIGVLAKILAKSPALEVLVTPSAPNADFFQVGTRALEYLSVDTGYDHQKFIANLARSSCFPKLRLLEFGEYHETYMKDFSAHLTPFADYRELFASPAFAGAKSFHWRHPRCSPEEMAEVKSLKKDCQVLVVQWSAEWIQ